MASRLPRQPVAPLPAAGRRRTKRAPSFSFADALAATPPPQNRREQILHAAVGLLTAEGFGALTQARVAELAAVRQSHITYYFPSRNDLLRETAVYGCNALLSALTAGVTSGVLNRDTLRHVMTADVHDRRFARLMCALIVASDEDARIKPWLASFDEANIGCLRKIFHHVGIPVTLDEVRFFHASHVGAVIIDLGESTPRSLAHAQRIVGAAFDAILQTASARGAVTATIKRGKR